MYNNIAVCKGCGGTIEGKFLYCPWCGFSRVSADDEETLSSMFDRFEENQKNTRKQHIYEMEWELDELEKELSVLVLSTEMHK